MNSTYIRIEAIKRDVSATKIALAKLFTEKQIDWNNKLIDNYLERTAKCAAY